MTEKKEIWNPIEGFEGTYEVSNHGRIRNVKRGGRIMSPCNVHGYRAVNLSKGGKTRSIMVHRIVAKTFIPNPTGKPQVNHIDGIKSNNCVCNLEWVTAQENINHAERTGLIQKGARGITPANFLIKSRTSRGWSQKELSEASGVSVNTIRSLESNVRLIKDRSVNTIYKLAKALGVSIEELAGYEKLPNKEGKQ